MDFGRECEEILERARDEVGSKLFLYVAAHHARYFTAPTEEWSSVIEQFPSTARDVEEGSKCFAVDRYTGCVYHMMRVAEAGLAAIAARIGLKNTKPGWVEAISYIEGQLNKNHQAMNDLFKGDTDFLRAC